MKRFLLTLMLLPTISLWSYASQITDGTSTTETIDTVKVSQKTTTYRFESIMDEYEDMNDVQSVRLTPKKMLSLISKKYKETDEKLFSKMDDLMLLSVSYKQNPSCYHYIHSAIATYISRTKMDMVLKLKEKNGETLEMFHKDDELIFTTTSDKKEYTIIFIRGIIDNELMSAVMEGKISFK